MSGRRQRAPRGYYDDYNGRYDGYNDDYDSRYDRYDSRYNNNNNRYHDRYDDRYDDRYEGRYHDRYEGRDSRYSEKGRYNEGSQRRGGNTGVKRNVQGDPINAKPDANSNSISTSTNANASSGGNAPVAAATASLPPLSSHVGEHDGEFDTPYYYAKETLKEMLKVNSVTYDAEVMAREKLFKLLKESLYDNMSPSKTVETAHYILLRYSVVWALSIKTEDPEHLVIAAIDLAGKLDETNRNTGELAKIVITRNRLIKKLAKENEFKDAEEASLIIIDTGSPSKKSPMEVEEDKEKSKQSADKGKQPTTLTVDQINGIARTWSLVSNLESEKGAAHIFASTLEEEDDKEAHITEERVEDLTSNLDDPKIKLVLARQKIVHYHTSRNVTKEEVKTALESIPSIQKRLLEAIQFNCATPSVLEFIVPICMDIEPWFGSTPTEQTSASADLAQEHSMKLENITSRTVASVAWRLVRSNVYSHLSTLPVQNPPHEIAFACIYLAHAILYRLSGSVAPKDIPFNLNAAAFTRASWLLSKENLLRYYLKRTSVHAIVQSLCKYEILRLKKMGTTESLNAKVFMEQIYKQVEHSL